MLQALIQHQKNVNIKYKKYVEDKLEWMDMYEIKKAVFCYRTNSDLVFLQKL